MNSKKGRKNGAAEKPVGVYNFVAKHDHNVGGAHTSKREYKRKDKHRNDFRFDA